MINHKPDHRERLSTLIRPETFRELRIIAAARHETIGAVCEMLLTKGMAAYKAERGES